MPQRVAVCSGKGGTGKTVFATALAQWLAGRGDRVMYLDADVEEPNGHLILQPQYTDQVAAEVPVPRMTKFRCSRCGQCVSACAFNALVLGGGGVLALHELCHGCGVCVRECSEGALRMVRREVGIVRIGAAGPVEFLGGALNVGEPRAVPIIDSLWDRAGSFPGVVIADAPPGTSCAAMATLSKAEAVVLVAEPTPFGEHDLMLALGLCRELGLPRVVVINRCDVASRSALNALRGRLNEPIIEMPFDPELAKAYASGQALLESSSNLRETLPQLALALESLNQPGRQTEANLQL